MAADLGFEEILVIHGAVGARPRRRKRRRAARAASAPDPEIERARVLHRFGDRVEIRAGAPGAAGARIPEISAALLESLTETERFGVEALRLRTVRRSLAIKAARPREGAAVGHARVCWRAAARGCAARAAAPAPAVGTSDYLAGSVALGVVIINGPTAATQFTAAEQTKVVAEVQAGSRLACELQSVGRRVVSRSRCGL